MDSRILGEVFFGRGVEVCPSQSRLKVNKGSFLSIKHLTNEKGLTRLFAPSTRPFHQSERDCVRSDDSYYATKMARFALVTIDVFLGVFCIHT